MKYIKVTNRISIFSFLILSMGSPALQADQEKNPDDVFNQVLNEHTDYFTNPTLSASKMVDPSETLVASASATKAHNGKGKHIYLPEVIFGNFKNAYVKVTIYSAPTCTHCSQYHKDTLPKIINLAKQGEVVLVLRSFISNMTWDIIASKISWAMGVNHQFDFMSKLFHDQEIWLMAALHNNEEEKQAYIKKLDDQLENIAKYLNISKAELKDKLLITKDDDPCGLLKIYALTHLKIDLNRLSAVLKDEKMERDFLQMTLNAKDEQGALLNFTPAIYIQKFPRENMDQGTLQERNLDVNAIKKLVDEAKTEMNKQRS